MEEWSKFSPYPAPGKVFRWEKGKANLVYCNYGDEKPKKGAPMLFQNVPFHFFAWRLNFLVWEWKGYIGSKRINLADPKFHVPEEWRALKDTRELSSRPKNIEQRKEWT